MADAEVAARPLVIKPEDSDIEDLTPARKRKILTPRVSTTPTRKRRKLTPHISTKETQDDNNNNKDGEAMNTKMPVTMVSLKYFDFFHCFVTMSV